MLEKPTFEIPSPPPPRPCADCDQPAEGDIAGIYYCTECGMARDQQRRDRAEQERREQGQRHVKQTLGNLGRRYPRMANWTLETYPNDRAATKARERIQAWLNDNDEQWLNMFIHGPVGTGKTGLAWATMREFFEVRWYEDVDFVNVRDLLAAAKRSYNDPAEPDPLEGLSTRSLLVMDDLGAERSTEWAVDVLATLIEERYQREYPTIVTSNYAPADLVTRLKPPGYHDDIIGQRIVSRLVESCMQIHLDGTDRRIAGLHAA